MKSNPEIDALDQNISKLRVEYERYFNGALDLPPTEVQEQLARQIRDTRSRMKGSVDQFRMNSVEARFNSFCEMFNRRVRNLEEGRSKVKRSKLNNRPRHDTDSGILVSDRIDDAAAAALYQGLYTGSAKSNKVDLDKFRGYLNQQASKLRQKTGCTQVQFRLANEGGKLKLKAKPVGKKDE